MVKITISVCLEIARLVAILILCLTIIEMMTHFVFIKKSLGTLCHQIPERCFSIGTRPIAICTRCLGLYLGIIMAKFLFPKYRQLGWLMFMIALPEVTMHFLGIDAPNIIRFISGYCSSSAIYLLLSWLCWEMPKYQFAHDQYC